MAHEATGQACGTETVAVSDWCEGGFAKWTVTDTDPNARYVWYNYFDPATALPGDYSPNGMYAKTNELDSSKSRVFYSPFRVTTANIAPSTTLEYTYIKVSDYKLQPYTAGGSTFTVSNTPTGTYSMAFNSAQRIHLNSVKVPVVLNTPGKQYKIQVALGTTAGPGSAVYNFSTLSATVIDATRNLYMVEIPVNLSIAPGAQTLVINTNPTGAGVSGAAVDGLGYSTTPATATTTPITIAANSAFQSTNPAGHSVIYDWNITVACPAKVAGKAAKTTTGCCTPPSSASTGLFSLNTDKLMLPADGSKSANLSAGGGSSSNVYAWYKDGVYVTSGVNMTTFPTSQIGLYEVRELTTNSVADRDNPSCFSRASIGIQKQEVFVKITQSPVPAGDSACIGESFELSGTGNDLIWSSSSGTLKTTTGTTNTFTGTKIGLATVFLKGQTSSSNLVVGGDFTGVSNANIITELAPTTATDGGIGQNDGSYVVLSDAYVGNSDWHLNNAVTTIPGNPGAFLMVNQGRNAAAKPLVWGQKIPSGIQAGNTYNFSFDFKSVSWIASDELDYTRIGQGLMTAPYRDVVLEAYVNGIKVGTASTDFATNGYDAVKNWMNFSFPWKAGAGVSSATLEIRITSPAVGDRIRGYDFGLDNISFAGSNEQTDEVVVGPFKDCSDITAVASACAGDYRTLTATVSGGMVFSHWEMPLGTSVGTTPSIQVSPLVPTNYYAVGVLPVGNLLTNGDFEGGANTGFTSGGDYFKPKAGNMATGGDNEFVVTNQTSAGNAYWKNMVPPVGGTRMFAADAKGPNPGKKIIAWTFNVVQGQEYLFSGYGANQHTDLDPLGQNYANTQSTPANIGIYIAAGSTAPANNGTPFTTLTLPKDVEWHQAKKTWTAPTTGTYTLYLADLNGSNGGGNDFVLDDFALQPLLGTSTKKFELLVENCACDPVDTLFASYCGKSGTFRVKDKYVNAGTYYGAYEWYKTATSVTPIVGSTARSGAQVQFTTQLTNATGPTLTPDSVFTVYLKDVTIEKPAIMPTRPAGCNVPTGTDQLDKYISKIVVYNDVTLKSLTALLNGYNAGNTTVNYTVNFYTSIPRNNPVPAITLTGRSATFTTVNQNGAPVPVDLPINQLLAGSVTGTEYWIEIKAQNVNQYPLNCTAAYPIKDNLGGTTVEISGTVSYGNVINNNTGSFYNYQFEKAPKACPRVPVQVYRKCPPCDKPATVKIGAPKSDTTVCNGAALTLKGSFTDGGNPIQYGAINYVWYKLANQSAVTSAQYQVAPGTQPYPVNQNIAINDKAFATTVAASDSGKWVLRVEDGTAGNVDCYTEDTIHIKINMPVVPGKIAMDTTLCFGSDAPAFTEKTAATGGNGRPFNYKWYQSPKNPVNYTRIAGATSATYDPGILPDTMLFYRRDSSGVCAPANTNTVQVNMLKELKGGKVGRDTSICTGTAPVAFREEASATGGDKNYKYQWQSTTNLANAFADVTTGTGATNAVYTAPNLSQTTYYRRVTRTTKPVCNDAYSDTIVVTVIAKNDPGAIAKDDSTCFGVAPNAITSLGAAVGSATPVYSWIYQEEGSTTWSIITDSARAELKPNALTKTTSFARIAVTGSGTCNLDTTDAVTIKVYNAVDAGTIGSDTTVCSGNAPRAFKGKTSHAGGIGSYDYQWIGSPTGNAPWTPIPSATDSSYAPPAQTVATTTTVYLKRVVKSGNCPADTNNTAVKFVILPPVTAGKIGNDTSICRGTPLFKFKELSPSTTGGDGTYTYKWKRGERQADGTYDFKYINAANGKELYPTSSDTVETKYVRIDSSSTCAAKYTDTVTVTIKGGPNPGKISLDVTACAGTTTTNIANLAAASGGTSAPVYFWAKNVGGNSWSPITDTSATNLTYTEGTPLNDTTLYARFVITGTGLCDASYTTMAYNIYEQTVAGAILKDTSICYSTEAPAFKAVKPTKGNGTYHYKWYQSVNGGGFNPIMATTGFSADSSVFDPGILTLPTSYRREVRSGNCPVITETAATISITQNDTIRVKILDANPKFCINSPATFVATPTKPGLNPTYQWYVDNIAVGTNSPQFSSTSLVNGQSVKVQLTSSLTVCVIGNPAMSNAVNVVITDSITPSITIPAPDESCVGLAVNLNATPSAGGVVPKYEWFVNGVSIGNNSPLLSSTTFNNNDRVTVTLTADSTGLPCYTKVVVPSNEVKLLIYNVPTPDVAQLDTSICEGGNINYLVHNKGGNIQWYKDTTKLVGKTDSLLVITNAIEATSGKYFAVESRKYCNGKSDTVNVKVIKIPVANAGTDLYVLDGDVVTLNGSGGGLYSWTPSDSLLNRDSTIANPKFIARENITYWLKVSDSTKLCSSTDDVKIFVERPIIIVNTFTPNGDGVNDGWVIKNIESFPKCIVKIYNRWGNLVWESNSYPNPWDGTDKFNGQLLPDGTYFYIIELNSTIFKNPYQGWVQIVK